MLNVAFRRWPRREERVVLVHGFTQSGDVWLDVAGRLSGGREVLAVDLPGHGRTPPEHDGADLWEAARLVGEVGEEATYAGYSLGARVLLHLAIAAPHLVRRLVVVGARAGFEDPAAAARRRADDDALADRIDALGQERLHEFVDDWLALPFNARLPAAARYRDLRLRNRAGGLSDSLRRCGSGVQQPLWARLPELTMPVLALYAEHDMPAVVDDNRRLAAAIGPNASTIRVPGVGHSIPFEAPDAFARIVEEFVGRSTPT